MKVARLWYWEEYGVLKNKVKKINKDIRDIKKKNNIYHEMKWVKLSASKQNAYMELVRYFF